MEVWKKMLQSIFGRKKKYEKARRTNQKIYDAVWMDGWDIFPNLLEKETASEANILQAIEEDSEAQLDQVREDLGAFRPTRKVKEKMKNDKICSDEVLWF